MGFYDRLEEISAIIDWYIEDLVWRYNKLGWEMLVLKFVPGNKILHRLAVDLTWAKEELDSCTESIGNKNWPEATYNAQAALAAVRIYTVAYNNHKYFWMRSL